MKMMTTYELAGRKDGELNALFTLAATNLLLAEAGTIDQHNALATLENIARVRAQRVLAP